MNNIINVDGKKWNSAYVREHGSEEEFVSKYLGEEHKHIYAKHLPDKRENAFRMVWKLSTEGGAQPDTVAETETAPAPADSGSEEPAGKRKRNTGGSK